MRTHWEFDDFGAYEEELEDPEDSFNRAAITGELPDTILLRISENDDTEGEKSFFRLLKKLPRILYTKQYMTPYCLSEIAML